MLPVGVAQHEGPAGVAVAHARAARARADLAWRLEREDGSYEKV